METTQPLPDRSAYPALSDDAITYDEFLRRNTATGTLKVQASRARGALPTPGVRISVIGRFTDARGALYQVFANHPAFEPNVYELEIFEGVNAILPVALQLQQEVM